MGINIVCLFNLNVISGLMSVSGIRVRASSINLTRIDFLPTPHRKGLFCVPRRRDHAKQCVFEQLRLPEAGLLLRGDEGPDMNSACWVTGSL